MKKYELLDELMVELTGWKPCPGTLIRWRRDYGLNTVRLRGRIHANREELVTFLETKLDRAQAMPPKSEGKQRSEASTAKALEQVDRELSELGI